MGFKHDKASLLEEFSELNDDNVILEKEIYAHFGLLFMKFSIVEHSLINIFTFSYVGTAFKSGKIQNKSQWEIAFDKGYEKACDQTFGNLVAKITKEPEFSQLKPRLSEQKRARDYFAHRFFREEILHFSDNASCWKLLIEISRLRHSTVETETALEKPFEAMSQRYGIALPNETQKSELLNELQEDYKKDVIDKKEPKFGWKQF